MIKLNALPSLEVVENIHLEIAGTRQSIKSPPLTRHLGTLVSILKRFGSLPTFLLLFKPC
jgi:hypothetical protein